MNEPISESKEEPISEFENGVKSEIHSFSDEGSVPEPEAETLADFSPKLKSEPLGLSEGCVSSSIYVDIVVPSVVFIAATLVALMIFSFVTQKSWWKRKCTKITRRRKQNMLIRQNSNYSVFSTGQLINDSTGMQVSAFSDGISSQFQSCHGKFSRSNSDTNSHSSSSLVDESLCSKEDKTTLEKFKSFQNNPKALGKISIPVVLSFAFCPFTILFYPRMSSFFWPPEIIDEAPKINDVIACFLMPAGIVYAVAFGFTFQEVLDKKQDLTGQMEKQMDSMRQMKNIVRCYTKIDDEKRMKIFRILKQYTLNVMEMILCDKGKQLHTGDLWNMLDILQEIYNDVGENATQIDIDILSTLYQHTLQLDNFVFLKDINRKINFLQWIFLECLGYITFFGILLIKADSYKLELTLCILTVVSISAFSYILADFDNPYHGAFRVDLSVYLQYVSQLDDSFSCLVTKRRRRFSSFSSMTTICEY